MNGLFVYIDDRGYLLRRLDTDPEVAKAAWRLTNRDGEEYDVHRDKHGLHCTCPDGIYRREGTSEPCKHARALDRHRVI